jgi:hypothetical protein
MGDEKTSLVERFAPPAPNTHTCEPRALVIQPGGSSGVESRRKTHEAVSKERRECFITETRFHLAEYKCFWRECQDESYNQASPALASVKANLAVMIPEESTEHRISLL